MESFKTAFTIQNDNRDKPIDISLGELYIIAHEYELSNIGDFEGLDIMVAMPIGLDRGDRSTSFYTVCNDYNNGKYI